MKGWAMTTQAKHRWLALALALSPLAACGVQGPLERPAPIFGEERRKYEAEQARLKAEADARAAADAEARGLSPTAPATPVPPVTTQPSAPPTPQ